jgi:hypothetical protein
MGLNIATTAAVAPKSDLTAQSQPGIYVSKDGSVAVKGDSDGSQKAGRPKLPATQVQVTSGTNGRTFVKDICKLKDAYKFAGRLEQYKLVRTDGTSPRLDF